MTKEEIINTPKLVDFMLDESVIVDSREKLRKRLEEVCNLAIQALEQDTVPFDFELYQAGLMDLPMEIRSIVATVLDDIKKKIEGLNPVDYVSISSYEGHKGARDIKDDILQIIDEYKNGELSNDEDEMDKNSPTARR